MDGHLPAFLCTAWDCTSIDVDYVSNRTIVVPGAFVGASYFLSRNFGLNAEAGYDITNVQFGIVFKLK